MPNLAKDHPIIPYRKQKLYIKRAETERISFLTAWYRFKPHSYQCVKKNVIVQTGKYELIIKLRVIMIT